MAKCVLNPKKLSRIKPSKTSKLRVDETTKNVLIKIQILQLEGILEDPLTGKEYRSASGLSVDEIVQIATVAKNYNRLNSYVGWIEAAFEVAKSENKSKDYISKVKKMLTQAKKDHDEVIGPHYKPPLLYFTAFITWAAASVTRFLLNILPFTK